MKQFYGIEKDFLILIHGGAGPQDPSKQGIYDATRSLKKIAKSTLKLLKGGESLLNAASHCMFLLENDIQFNAGIGSALQSDGVPRLSASIMNGVKQSFSGVISATYIPNPSILAKKLQTRRAKVLTTPGTELLARELSIPIHSNLTESRSKNWLMQMEKENYPSKYYDCDTVGCIIKDPKGKLVAASSTGGTGNEYPGRVGDTATVAGNYASKFAAIAVTGKGEQITDDAVAARLETRIRDGMTLEDASHKSIKEALAKKRRYGWIVVDHIGNWGVAHITDFMPFVVYNSKKLIKSS